MTPYFDNGQVSIYHGDCVGIAPYIGEPCDLVILDPPYGVTSLEWDDPIVGVSAVITDITKPTATVWQFGSMAHLLSGGALSEPWKYVQDVVWKKQNGSNFHNDRFRRIHEHVVQWRKDGAAWSDVYKSPQYTMDAVKKQARRKKRPAHMGQIDKGHYLSHDGGPRLQRSVLEYPNCHGYAVHPTQKPVDLLEVLIRYACPPGGLVLDPCCGSGSTLVAAVNCGMRAIGIDISEQWCYEATKRVKQEAVAA